MRVGKLFSKSAYVRVRAKADTSIERLSLFDIQIALSCVYSLLISDEVIVVNKRLTAFLIKQKLNAQQGEPGRCIKRRSQ